jgi:hypothetical protein
MKNLFILLVIVFFVFGCTVPQGEKTIEKTIIKDGQTWELTGVNKQIYPAEATMAFNQKLFNVFSQIVSGQELYAADPAVDPIIAADDLDNKGIVYRQNSFSGFDSIVENQLNYIDVGTLVGHKQKLLIRVKFTMLDQGNNANAPMVHVRAKGSKDPWEILNPNMTTDDVALIVTNDQGEIEWYHDNGAPKIWENLTEGWDKIAGYADYYIIGIGI